MSTSTSPVHVSATLDEGLSRWRWLFKWLLALPHYVVLAFLWLAFFVLSLVAFVAILVTGRYPRSIFDFNVGVLRWTWRVSYYAYGALATDRYPPFSLDERPDYPAHLEIDYPEHLSRGLVLVKSWLLALPHYLVLALFLGGAGYALDGPDDPGTGTTVWSWGLIGVLVTVAAVVLLFTGRYPQPVFELVLGLHRWVLRVAAYVALMTDSYPPFRLDQGGRDPATATLRPSETSPTPPGTPPASGAPRRTGWTAGRVVALVIGTVVGLAALGLAATGVTLAIIGATMRDDAGFLTTGEERLVTETYALTSDNIELHVDGPATLTPSDFLGDTVFSATAPAGETVFVGIAATSDVEGYLGDVEHATVTEVAGDPSYRLSGDGAPATAPVEQTFWVDSASGAGEQSVVWAPGDGDWTLVVMNPDGTAGVDAEVTAGAELPALDWVVAGLLVVAAAGLVVGGVLVGVAVHEAARR